MISARELRIGNFIHSNTCGCTMKVDQLRTTGLEVESTGEIYYLNTELYEYLQPIPLTEECLLKFGFEKIEDKDGRTGFKFFFDNLVFVGMKIDDVITIVCKVLGSEIGHPIKYIHQLQNFYFTLTGNELELKTVSTD